MATVTGHVKLVKRKRGDKFYVKYRMPSGKQVMKLLGPAWTERSRPPAGNYTRRPAEESLSALLTDIRRGEVPDPGDRGGKVLADAVAEWLRYVEHEKDRRPSTVRDYRNTATAPYSPSSGQRHRSGPPVFLPSSGRVNEAQWNQCS